MLQVVIFGSAAGPNSQDANDIDVAYRGDRQAAVGLASAWAGDNGLGNLPLDVHESAPSADGAVVVPSPCGIEVPAVALTTDTTIRVRTYRTIASYVRAHGGDPGWLATTLPDWERLTVVPPPGRERVPDWMAYVGGLAALRAAVAKTPDPQAVTDVLVRVYGPVLGRLLVEDPRPAPDALERLQANTSAPNVAGAVVHLARIGGPFGGGTVERSRDLETLLYGS